MRMSNDSLVGCHDLGSNDIESVYGLLEVTVACSPSCAVV